MKKTAKYLLLALIIVLNSCGQSKGKPFDIPKNTTMKNIENPYYSNTDKSKINVSNEEWKKILTQKLYKVAREADTEMAFTGTMWNDETKGTYYCAVCGNKLFRSNQKFTSSCGWPSFFEQENKNSIHFKPDNSYGMQRIEALCSRCDSHLGHLFDDGPKPTGKRYCMNAISLDFIPDEVQKSETIVLGGGCFWCVEAIYESIDGVEKVISGYAGGTVKNPTYEEVCTGKTGAAEVVEITFGTTKTNIDELFQVFFTVHDPTSLNRQGEDIGTQYRSVIFYKNETEKKTAENLIKELNDSGAFPSKIVTSLEKLDEFYPAEDYHQNYYNQNKEKPYCKMVVRPKIEKFEKVFKDRLKK